MGNKIGTFGRSDLITKYNNRLISTRLIFIGFQNNSFIVTFQKRQLLS